MEAHVSLVGLCTKSGVHVGSGVRRYLPVPAVLPRVFCVLGICHVWGGVGKTAR